MKHLLTPITMTIWFLTTYWGIYFSIVLMFYTFTLGWFWIIVGYTIIVGLIFAITNSLPGLLRMLILNFYKFSWFSVITHSLSGLAGVITLFLFFDENPIQHSSGTPVLEFMWQEAPFKTILLAFPFIGLICSLIWSTVLSPIWIKVVD